jgi:hypothetical protein
MAQNRCEPHQSANCARDHRAGVAARVKVEGTLLGESGDGHASMPRLWIQLYSYLTQGRLGGAQHHSRCLR